MYTKDIVATLFGLLIILLMGTILFIGLQQPVSVIIQAGHEGRTTGNTGASAKYYNEQQWNTYVADEVATQLHAWGISVKRIPATLTHEQAKIAIAIHFDGARQACQSGASIGYPDRRSYGFAQRWKSLYTSYFPYRWHPDNFTPNLAEYYAYKKIDAEKFLVLELGEISCRKQRAWLKPRLTQIAHLIAYTIATELGEVVQKPLR